MTQDMNHTFVKALRAVLAVAMMSLTGSHALAQSSGVRVNGSVYGGGNQADVQINTEVIISAGYVHGSVYGGGKGSSENFECDKAMVGKNNDGAGKDPGIPDNKDKGTKVNITNGTVNGNVYGGGELGRVEWNTQVTIGEEGNTQKTPTVNGSVFGAGAGVDTHGYSALVRGNSTVTIQGKAKVLQNVYGGGEKATVGRYWVKGINNMDGDNVIEDAKPVPADLPDGMPYKQQSGGVCTVIIKDQAKIGPEEAATETEGHAFGAGKGVVPGTYDFANFSGTNRTNYPKRMALYDPEKYLEADKEKTWEYVDPTDPENKNIWEYFNTEDKYHTFLQTLSLVTNSNVTIGGGSNVKGSVYGGSESGFVQHDTSVTIEGSSTIGTNGTAEIDGNVFGGGLGLASFAEAGRVGGNTIVNVNGGTVWRNVYGGGSLGSLGKFTYEVNETTHSKTYTWTEGGTSNVTIDALDDNTTVIKGNVFGAGKGSNAKYECEPAMALHSNVTVNNGTVNGTVYGGGEIGRVDQNTTVTIGKAGDESSEPDIKGDVFGAGAGVNTHGYSALVRGNSSVTIQGKAKVANSVYGGGKTASVGRFVVDAETSLPKQPVSGGICTVSIKDKASIGYNGGGDVYGACKGVEPGEWDKLPGHVTANSDVPTPFTSEADYLHFLKTLALTSNTEVTIGGTATINGSVYGGGQRGVTLAGVKVDMTGGTVKKDVYGGGALADTNTENWDGTELTLYHEETRLTLGSSVVGYYTKSGDKYTLLTSGTAEEGTTYYRFTDTKVNLLGGTIEGDAYGGGLGQLGAAVDGVHFTQDEIDAAQEGDPAYGKTTKDWKTEPVAASDGAGAVKAMVYGDVSVNLGDESKTKATAFTISHYTDEGYTDVVKSGRVFGCNNLNGSPKGNVTVTVYKTTGPEGSRTDSDKKTSTNASDHKYQLAAVYGGGNLADYIPAETSMKTKVKIMTCEVSVQEVYGGGNAAAVPATDVLVNGAWEINQVFGGGNGKDDYFLDEEWHTNPGANVGGDAITLLTGGYIHEAYGGSNSKGTISGDINISKGTGGECDLTVVELYGAGKDADVEGDLILVMGCSDTRTEAVYGCSMNANVKGNVELTITSGEYGKVFGGNNKSGAIFGHIIVNIEETGCTPIIIDELYGCGNDAAYSVYGYYQDGTIEGTTKPKYVARTSLTDEHAAVTFEGKPHTDPGENGYDDPEVNIYSCTRIGKVFGGGYGAGATVYGNPKVNINQMLGIKSDGNGGYITATELGRIGVDKNGSSDDCGVFGGGNQAKVFGNTTINIGTETEVDLHASYDKTTGNYTYIENQTVLGANILSSVFGGGNEANVTGDTHVNICGTQIVDQTKENGYTDTSVSHSETTGFAVSIGNSVYGGGNKADVEGNTFVTMADGYVFNGIFGGGYSGSVGTFTSCDKTVTIWNHNPSHEGTCIGKPTACKEGTGTCYVVVSGGQIGPLEVATHGMNRTTNGHGDPVPQGWVWGAGCGLVEDPSEEPDTHFKTYVNKTDVTIKGDAFILESIIGGGEFGRVLGNTLVKIEGGQIGVGENKVTDGKPVAYTAEQWREAEAAVRAGDASRINAIAAAMPACSTFPYGREVNGKMVYDTYDPFADAYKTAQNSDKYPGGSTDHASDGKTWIGCVFAGGSGYMPYVKRNNSNEITDYDWVQSAGWVEGDAEVRISGGHILSNVYGGNEYTDVKGTCKVTMTGGTVGVPRTVEQIMGNPMIGYIYGAGKGDPRVHFNKVTNVGDVEVEITGGTVFGSVYGGGEDGHVLRNVTMTIGSDGVGDAAPTGPFIGTWGTSYVDGNVFGGGRGFSGEAYTAGNVAGSVDLDIKGGTILGSVYGGGRMGSVGYGLFDATTNNQPTPGYGEMRDDTDTEAGFNTSGDFTNGRGHIDITISGGIIGNNYEYIMPNSTNMPGGLSVDNIGSWTPDNWTAWKAHNNIHKTEFDTTTRQLKHTKGGNVFAGGMGNLFEQDGTTNINLVDWWKLGCVKSTKLTITGGTIKSNVYGGGELGQVVGCHTTDNVKLGTEISISGSNTIIGTEVKESSTSEDISYTFGSVFGGGYGSLEEKITLTGKPDSYPKYIAGRVMAGTKVNMTAGTVKASVYGGGEMAAVGESVVLGETLTDGLTGDTHVTISGGTIGKSGFGGAKMGNVYGGGSGHNNTVRSGQVFGNTNVTINGGTIYHNIYGGGAYGSVGDFTYSMGYDEQAGANKVVGISNLHPDHTNTGVATVTITGGTIGVNGKENGMVFGSSRGDINQPEERDDHTAWVYNTFVTIGTSGVAAGPNIKGSVYGSGENGHTFNDAVVNIHSGTIGITDKNIDDGARYPNRGNVYGGGCGTDTYTDTGGEYYNNLAGIVYGTATVNMDGGHVVHNVYGAGAMGSVGKFAFDTNGKPTGLENDAPENSGKCYINISGGQIGMTGMQMTATGGPDDYGHVFGAGRGELHDPADYPNLEVSGYVNNTNVEISGTAFVTGSVYGGGENGHVLGNTSVTVSGGQIGCGDGETGPYTSGWDGTSMKECASWPYTDNGATYDMYAGTPNYNSEGGSKEATDGHTFYGNVFGGGSGYTPYAAGKWMRSAGRVEGNTSVTITDGHILTNVYGGNEQTDVGNGLSLEAGKGKCTVTMTGGTVGVPRTHSDRLAHPVTGNVFGAGKGDKRVLFNRWTNVGSTEVSISGGTVYGSVFGGGEDGHVLGNAKTTISETSTDKPTIIGTLGTTGSDGNVFGGGRGSVTALTAGVVCGDVSLDILGGMIKGSVYGGGRLASLGTYLVATGDSRYGKQIRDGKNQVIGSNSDVDAPGVTHGHVTINISGGTIGALDGEGKVKVSANSIGDVYGGCKGTTEGTLHDVLGVSKSAIVNLLGGTVGNSIYGGGEVGNVGELGEGDNPATAFAKINLLGGSVKNVYGGGLGKKIVSQDIDSKAFVKGDVTVNLNGLETGDYDSNIHTMVEAIEEDGVNGVDFYRLPIANRANGCKVLGNIFGCNNVNGTPTGHSKVHVFMTTPQTGQLATEYDISAIYGGGNQADYEPDPNVDNNKQSTEVIIEGCGLTKIQQVYGGGNAAASPGTSVLIKGTELIDEVFGGGNGVSTETFENPGANVGYHTDKSLYNSGDGKANVQLMAGTVHNVYGGSNSNGDIRGGSSITKPTPVWKDGNGVNASCCPELAVDQIFGGGKNADMRSGAEIVLGCMPDDWIGEIYAGAEMANVNGNVSLTLTSGKFGRVFGGNKTSGILNGSITVNIDENGECEVPIVIGELYGGGNMAAYSIYGYEGDEPRTKAQYDALTAEQKAAIGLEHPHESPVVNVHGFTSIGNIFGGGYGEDADLYGNPTVNINEVLVTGNKAYKFTDDNSANKPTALIDDVNVTLNDHDLGNMGVINNVFGGGNAALVDGNTTVNIATEENVYVVKLVDVGNSVNGLYKRVKNETTGEVTYTIQGTNDKAEEGSNYYQLLPVQGADIRGNVYGGGNQAEVTGDTNVVIGRSVTPTP